MDEIKLFDAHAYFKALATKNKLTKAHKFHPCSCSGIYSLEGVLDQFRRQSAFVCIDDTNDGATTRRGGGFFKKRTATVFLLIRYRIDDMADRNEKLELCREIMRQFHSRMIIDKENYNNDMEMINVDNIYSRELGQYFLSGCTGLYFMLESDEPINLCYDGKEWEEE